MVNLSLLHYPFCNHSVKLLAELDITIQKIDETADYDEILKEVCIELVDAITYKKLNETMVITELEKSTREKEVIKFYFSLLVIKTSNILTKMFIRYYLKKFEIIINHYSFKFPDPIALSTYYMLLFKEFDLYWELVRNTGEIFFKTHVTNYSIIDTLIYNSDPREYQLLKLVNCALSKGYVYFSYKDTKDFQRMLNKLLENRIITTVNNTPDVDCKKVAKCRDELGKYLKDKSGISYSPFKKEIQFSEPTIEDMVKNEMIIKSFDKFVNNEKYESMLSFDVPPCILVIFDQIRRKDPLVHNQNILLCSYLVSKGYTEDQIVNIFRYTSNFKESVARYNIKYIFNKKLKPMNCHNLMTENLCNKHLDKTKQCDVIKNPLSWRSKI